MRKSVALSTAVCMLPVLLALTDMGRTHARLYTRDNGIVSQAGETTWENDNGDENLGYFCFRSIGACILCGACHTNGQDRSKEVYTSTKHNEVYYPKATLLHPEGQRLSWGEDGGYLMLQAGRLQYYSKDGTLAMTAPTGSSVLKDAAGRPFVLWMPGEPTLHPKSR